MNDNNKNWVDGCEECEEQEALCIECYMYND